MEQVICNDLSDLGFDRCKPYMYKKDQYRIRLSSKRMYSLIVNEFGYPQSEHGSKACWSTPLPVKNAPFSFQIEYLRGFVDAEGSVISSRKGIQIDVSQKCLEPLKFLYDVFSRLEIDPSGIYLGSDGVWRLRIASRSSLLRFALEVGFRIRRKQEKLMKELGLTQPPAQQT